MRFYRVAHLLADLGWVDSVLRSSQAGGPLLQLSTAQARWWNILNLSQPNPGPRGDGPPCRCSLIQCMCAFVRNKVFLRVISRKTELQLSIKYQETKWTVLEVMLTVLSELHWCTSPAAFCHAAKASQGNLQINCYPNLRNSSFCLLVDVTFFMRKQVKGQIENPEN